MPAVFVQRLSLCKRVSVLLMALRQDMNCDMQYAATRMVRFHASLAQLRHPLTSILPLFPTGTSPMSTRTIQSLRSVSRRLASSSSAPPLFCGSIRSGSPTSSSSSPLSAAVSKTQAQRPYSSALSATLSRQRDFSRPAPPALPPHLQREFDELVRRAQTPAAPGVKLESEADGANASTADPEQEMHPDLRRKPKPEFEGDRNPVTGEVGGPKIEPLKHGASSSLTETEEARN